LNHSFLQMREPAATALVRVRVDAKVKNEASDVLAKFGLTVSDIVRMALTRVVDEGAMPLGLKVPNAGTRAAMRESRRIMKQHRP
jgi:DNA-damage-inducible protein J